MQQETGVIYVRLELETITSGPRPNNSRASVQTSNPLWAANG
jgi:hypothetical protein